MNAITHENFVLSNLKCGIEDVYIGEKLFDTTYELIWSKENIWVSEFIFWYDVLNILYGAVINY